MIVSPNLNSMANSQCGEGCINKANALIRKIPNGDDRSAVIICIRVDKRVPG